MTGKVAKQKEMTLEGNDIALIRLPQLAVTIYEGGHRRVSQNLFLLLRFQFPICSIMGIGKSFSKLNSAASYSSTW
jgi:hypothetical protein